MGRRGQAHFHFQQFSILQDRCAMKVGSDGILLGAWASIHSVRQILDIGTGTGLIALMLAQRNSVAKILGIEIDQESSIQAQENVRNSPWSDRINIYNISYQDHHWQQKYDLVISNPPFFSSSNKSNPRAIARSQLCLSPTEIIQTISPYLTHQGKLALIVPIEQANTLIETAIAHQLFPSRRTNVRPTPSSKLKRALLELSVNPMQFIENEIILEIERHQYSAEYQRLIQKFFLKFSSNSKTAGTKRL